MPAVTPKWQIGLNTYQYILVHNASRDVVNIWYLWMNVCYIMTLPG